MSQITSLFITLLQLRLVSLHILNGIKEMLLLVTSKILLVNPVNRSLSFIQVDKYFQFFLCNLRHQIQINKFIDQEMQVSGDFRHGFTYPSTCIRRLHCKRMVQFSSFSQFQKVLISDWISSGKKEKNVILSISASYPIEFHGI